MRLLHAGHGADREGAAGAEPGPDRRRGPGRARGQHLPLHRLRVHRRRGAARGRADGGGVDVGRRRHRPAEALRRTREAHRGPALPDRPRPLRRRHRAAQHAARRVRPQRLRARRPRLDRHRRRARAGGRARRRHRRRHRRPGAADHVQLAVPVVAADRLPGAAADRVRFVGEAIAAVVADDRYIAEDAVDLVAVEYSPLEVLPRSAPRSVRARSASTTAGRTTSSSSATSRSASRTGCSTRPTPYSSST